MTATQKLALLLDRVPLVFHVPGVSRLIALSLAAQPLDSNYKQRS